jgi:hypothetical protein
MIYSNINFLFNFITLILIVIYYENNVNFYNYTQIMYFVVDEFRCHNGNCIWKSLVCNDMYDCDDYSDERNCRDYICNENFFKCTTGKCIPQNWECDGQVLLEINLKIFYDL